MASAMGSTARLRFFLSRASQSSNGYIGALPLHCTVVENKRSLSTTRPLFNPTRPWAPLKGPNATEIYGEIKERMDAGLRSSPKALHALSQKLYTESEIEMFKDAIEMYRKAGVPVDVKYAEAMTIQLRKLRGAMQKRAVQAKALASILGNPQRYRLFVRPAALHPCLKLMVDFGYHADALAAIESHVEPPDERERLDIEDGPPCAMQIKDNKLMIQILRTGSAPETFPRVMDLYMASRSNRFDIEHYEVHLLNATRFGTDKDLEEIFADYAKEAIEQLKRLPEIKPKPKLYNISVSTLRNELSEHGDEELLKNRGVHHILQAFEETVSKLESAGYSFPSAKRLQENPDPPSETQ